MKIVYTNSDGKVVREIPMTNFESITSSPEALAGLMLDCASCNNCQVTDKSICKYKYENCKETWVEWLKQEIDAE